MREGPHLRDLEYGPLLQLLYFITVVHLLLCLIYKGTVIGGVYVQERHSLCRAWCYLWVQATTGGLPRIMGRGLFSSLSSVGSLSPRCALEITGDFKKMWKPGVHPKHADVIGLGVGTRLWHLLKAFQGKLVPSKG